MSPSSSIASTCPVVLLPWLTTIVLLDVSIFNSVSLWTTTVIIISSQPSVALIVNVSLPTALEFGVYANAPVDSLIMTDPWFGFESIEYVNVSPSGSLHSALPVTVIPFVSKLIVIWFEIGLLFTLILIVTSSALTPSSTLIINESLP